MLTIDWIRAKLFIMSLRHNRPSSHQGLPRGRTLALASALLLAVSASVAPEAGASTHPTQSRSVSAGKERKPGKTPQNILAGIIANLEEGGSATVTAEPLELADNNGTVVKGKPFVFWDGKEGYLAFEERHGPDFGTTPAATAKTLQVISLQTPGSTGLALESVHLDSRGVLVENGHRDGNGSQGPVGFATAINHS
jgi:hypothetical protein